MLLTFNIQQPMTNQTEKTDTEDIFNTPYDENSDLFTQQPNEELFSTYDNATILEKLQKLLQKKLFFSK